jgi:DHA2 family multidrug resistance protein-like MFS transporter
LGAGKAIALGLVVAALGLGLIGIALSWDGYVGIVVGMAIIGLGIGIASTLANDAVVTAAPKERAGAAAAIAETTYELGIALGIAILGSFHALIYQRNLALPAHAPASIQEAAGESLAVLLQHAEDYGPQAAEFLASAQSSFSIAVQATIAIAAVIVLLAAVLAWRLIPWIRETQEKGASVPSRS